MPGLHYQWIDDQDAAWNSTDLVGDYDTLRDHDRFHRPLDPDPGSAPLLAASGLPDHRDRLRAAISVWDRLGPDRSTQTYAGIEPDARRMVRPDWCNGRLPRISAGRACRRLQFIYLVLSSESAVRKALSDLFW